jgi:hypothetical protein
MSEKSVDMLPAVRAMVKMTSALNEFDLVEESKYNKFMMKKVMKSWYKYHDSVSTPMMKYFMSDHEGALQSSFNIFDEYSSETFIGDEDKTALVLLYSKLKSAVNDLQEMDFHSKGLMLFAMQKETEKLVTQIEKQYNAILTRVDSEGNDLSVIVDGLDSLGKSMFVNSEKDVGELDKQE